jgi:hypothetical protein
VEVKVMGKRNEDGSYEPEYSGETAAGIPAASAPGLLTIEEHTEKHKVSAPVFAAVKAMKGWNAGKKVSEWEFKEAVNVFLGSPIGGK